MLTESQWPTLKAAEQHHLNQTPTPIEQAAYRLATIAAPFSALGKSNAEAISLAIVLMRDCLGTVTSAATFTARANFENPDLVDREALNIFELREAIPTTDKTLKSYVLEASRLVAGSKVSGENQVPLGKKLWARLLAGEQAISREVLDVMKSLRAKRFKESRKAKKKPVK
jgi:hypothetical protein